MDQKTYCKDFLIRALISLNATLYFNKTYIICEASFIRFFKWFSLEIDFIP